ncbi:MAG: hypothetical protein NT175_06875 [Bacteroidetes bacterium]|nr:hypothetical protein [Bacteroidota bacterium]
MVADHLAESKIIRLSWGSNYLKKLWPGKLKRIELRYFIVSWSFDIIISDIMKPTKENKLKKEPKERFSFEIIVSITLLLVFILVIITSIFILPAPRSDNPYSEFRHTARPETDPCERYLQ